MWIYPCILLIKMRYISMFKGGGGFFPAFAHVDRGEGVCKMSTFVHSRGGGGQNLVHVVVECPLRYDGPSFYTRSSRLMWKGWLYSTLKISAISTIENQKYQIFNAWKSFFLENGWSYSIHVRQMSFLPERQIQELFY